MDKVKKRMLSMICLCVLVVVIFMPCNVAFATNEISAEQDSNVWVLDEAGIISNTTKEYIKNLNEIDFAEYDAKPQFSVLIIKKLPSSLSMEEYKQFKFNEYGIGTAEENCGMLFVLAVEDREYGLEIGDGYYKYSELRRWLENDVMDEDMLISCYVLATFTNCPFLSDVRTLWIETAMTTGEHQWLANIFPKSVIESVMSKQVDTVNGIAGYTQVQDGDRKVELWSTNHYWIDEEQIQSIVNDFLMHQEELRVQQEKQKQERD